MTFTKDPIFVEICEIQEAFRKRMLDRLEKGQQKRKACKIKNVIESKIAQEMKLNVELKTRLAELSKKGDDLDRVCANFTSGVTISDSDQNRLENAKEMLDIAKQLTGIRFDFSAPSTVAKGYIKSETRRTLTPFEVPAASAPEQLWAILQDFSTTVEKENKQPST